MTASSEPRGLQVLSRCRPTNVITQRGGCLIYFHGKSPQKFKVSKQWVHWQNSSLPCGCITFCIYDVQDLSVANLKHLHKQFLAEKNGLRSTVYEIAAHCSTCMVDIHTCINASLQCVCQVRMLGRKRQIVQPKTVINALCLNQM